MAIYTENFEDWSGAGFATYPTGWTLITNGSSSSDLRIYESSAGIARFLNIDANPSIYLGIRYDGYLLTPGTRYIIKLTYRSTSSYSLKVGYDLYNYDYTLPSTGGSWDTVNLEVFNSSGGSGSRKLLIFSTGIDIEIDTLILNYYDSVTAVEIIQDNVIDDCNLMAVHSPLIFLIDAEYSGTLPNFLFCDIEYNSIIQGTFKCLYYSDPSVDTRRFMFIAHDFLKAFMESFVDLIQTSASILQVSNIVREFDLRFYNANDVYEDSVNIMAIHASQQFGSNPALLSLFENETKIYLAAKNMPVYIYFYNQDDATDIVIEQYDKDGNYENEFSYPNADKGLYRLKVSNLTANKLYKLTIAALYTELYDSWSGAGYETYPTGWTLRTPPAHDQYFYIYENPTGSALFYFDVDNFGIPPLTGLAIYQSSWALTLGKSYNAVITYKSNYACTLDLGYREPSIPSWNVNSHVLQDTFGEYVTETLSVKNTTGAGAPRYFVMALQPQTGVILQLEIATLKIYEVGSGSEYSEVRVIDFCDNDKYIKYLDKSGLYRFLKGNQFYEVRDNITLIGKTNKLITSILTDQTNKEIIGYRNDRQITILIENIAEDEIDFVSDIYTSPEVLLYVGDGTTDIASDWVKVEVSGDNLVKSRKLKYNNITLILTLPEHFTITRL